MTPIITILVGVLKLLLALIVLGIGTERGTQLFKEFLRAVGEKFPIFNFKDRRSFFLAAVVAVGVTYFFKVDLTQYLTLLDGFDPSLVKIVTSLIIMFFSNVTHDTLFKSPETIPQAG
jgi:hypothetical protein